MTTQASPAAIPLPRHRADPFLPPDAYAGLRDQRPVSRLTLADGSQGWLVTRYDDVRAVLADPRFSAADRTAMAAVRAETPEMRDRAREQPTLIMMDPPDHTRHRRLLTGQFSVRRMRQLGPRVRGIVRDHLTALADAGPPADLVGTFALPIPSLVICELLGVPIADRDMFQSMSRTILTIDVDPAQALAAGDEMTAYMAELVRRKRVERPDDLLGALADPEHGLSDEELTGIGNILLIAGHETTANMIGLATFLLLQRPRWWADLVASAAAAPPDADAELAEPAVEELLRYLSVVQFGIERRATEDVEFGGELIRAEQIVVCMLPAANHDPERFAEPERLALDEARPAHVAFGHGVHQCVGQQLARVELRTALSELARRLPTLRLAVPPGEVPLRHEMLVYGVDALPVTWEPA